MAEFTSRELIEAIYDVRDRVTRIEEQLTNRTEQIQKRADEAYLKGDNAEKVSATNTNKIETLEERMDSMMTWTRWAIGLTISSLIASAGLLITLLNFLK